MTKRVLVVDDDPVQRRLLEETIKRLGFEVRTASTGEQAVAILEGADRATISLVLLDLVMPDLDGMGVLERLSAQARHAADHRADRARLDRHRHPGDARRRRRLRRQAGEPRAARGLDPLRLKIEALAVEIVRIKKKVEGTLTFADLIVRGDAMARVISLGKRAAASNIPVLIEGESGVGKELIARAIQGESERAGKPFVTVNCGAIPENLVESILFGHEKGSFTGAADKRIGKFQEADGGTLFLDEVGELPLDAQVKLLRALQEGEIDPVGAKKPVKVNFRLISATNRDMIQLVKDGKFREDLYYRLNVFPIWVPPLRERIDDVPELARHFLARFAAEEGKRVGGLTDDAVRLLTSYGWPGNVRQLENAVFRAVVLADGRTSASTSSRRSPPTSKASMPRSRRRRPLSHKQPAYTGPALLGAENTVPQTVSVATTGTRSSLGIPAIDEAGEIRTLEAIEADMIRLALGRYRGHMTEVARRLGIGRSTLYRKMQDYGLEQNAT